MKAIFITDIHGRFEKVLQLPAADILVVGGDITNCGGTADLDRFLEMALSRFPRVLAVAGNCDPVNAEASLFAMGCGIMQDGRSEGGVRFFGISGAPYHHGVTPFEWPDDTAAKWLPMVPHKPAVEPVVLVTHAPPHGEGTARLMLGFDAGSRAVAAVVARLRPVLVLSGHLHEVRGIFPMAGGGLAVNPGPLRSGHYAVIEFQDELPPVVSLCTL